MTNLIANIERLRDNQGLSMAELARRVGMSSVKMILNGSTGNPRMETLEALAKVLGVTVSDLYAAPARRKRKAKKRNAKKRRRKAS